MPENEDREESDEFRPESVVFSPCEHPRGIGWRDRRRAMSDRSLQTSRLPLAARTHRALGVLALVLGGLFLATPASQSATTAVRPLLFSTSYATFSIQPDGSGWRQLNECTLVPFTTNGRHLIGTVSGITTFADMLALPASRQIVGDCETTGDPVRRKYDLRGEAGVWLSLDWSPTAPRVVGVELVGKGLGQHGAVVTFSENGTGHRVVTPRGLDTRVRENAGSAAWSPTGKQIVFGRTFFTDDCPEYEETRTIGLCDRRELVRMNADGSNAVSLYRPPQIDVNAKDDLAPDSPFRKLSTDAFFPFAWHGSKIFMTTSNQAGSRLASINADGSGFRFLTAVVNDNPGQPALSPMVDR